MNEPALIAEMRWMRRTKHKTGRQELPLMWCRDLRRVEP